MNLINGLQRGFNKRRWTAKASKSTTDKKKIIVSSIVGIVIGVFTSLIVNATMVEISFNSFFSVYFGVIFMIIGSSIMYGIWENKSEEMKTRQGYLMIFASLVICSGIFCFFVEKDWFSSLSPLQKIPLYAIIGTTISYCVVFSFIDLINISISYYQDKYDRRVVESHFQAYAILFNSIMSGFIYGLIFGLSDLEDALGGTIMKDFKREEVLCVPFGVISGLIGGFMNEIMRQKGMEYMYSKTSSDKYTDEI